MILFFITAGFTPLVKNSYRLPQPAIACNGIHDGNRFLEVPMDFSNKLP